MALETLNSPSSANSLLHSEDMVDQAWSKGKRTKRSRHDNSVDSPTAEEEYLALCLLMLAQGGGRGGGNATTSHQHSWPPPSTVNHYACSVCNKAFPSYQALGGHKASHKKLMLVSVSDVMTKKSASISLIAGDSSGGKGHQCSVCLKTFPSGQALGGHKRRHFEGSSTGDGDGHILLPDDIGLISHSHRDFDLNLLPAFAAE